MTPSNTANPRCADSYLGGFADLQSGQVEQVSTVSSGPLWAGWQHIQGESHAYSHVGNVWYRVESPQRHACGVWLGPESELPAAPIDRSMGGISAMEHLPDDQ